MDWHIRDQASVVRSRTESACTDVADSSECKSIGSAGEESLLDAASKSSYPLSLPKFSDGQHELDHEVAISTARSDVSAASELSAGAWFVEVAKQVVAETMLLMFMSMAHCEWVSAIVPATGVAATYSN